MRLPKPGAGLGRARAALSCHRNRPLCLASVAGALGEGRQLHRGSHDLFARRKVLIESYMPATVISTLPTADPGLVVSVGADIKADKRPTVREINALVSVKLTRRTQLTSPIV